MELAIEMDLVKETKGTYVYKADGQVIDTLYIRKSAFNGSVAAPKITVNVETLKATPKK